MTAMLRLLASLAAAGVVVPTAAAASEPQRAAPADTAALEFGGFRAGARLDEIDALVRRREGNLRCDRARADRRVTECRGRFLDSDSGEAVTLWISAIDSVAGIITLRAETPGDRLDRWRDGIVARYGKVGARAQGTQWMMQWVRRGRMLRLTWREERGGRVASVSLVDGRVLDGWGRDRARTKLVSRDSLPNQRADSL